MSVRSESQEFHVYADFLADATGKGSLLAARRRRCSPQTLALYADWRETGLAGAHTRVEAGETAWFWGAPLPDGSFNAAVFVGPAELSAAKPQDHWPLYRSLLAQSELLRNCLDGTMVGKLHVCSATRYADELPIDERSIKVGEASFSIDPISSQRP